MHLLHRALDQDGELRATVEGLSRRIAENPAKHALLLDLNPFWLAAYRAVEAGFSERAVQDFIYPGGMPFTRGGWPSLGGGGVLDLSRKFRGADKATEWLFERPLPGKPYMLRIFARPASVTSEEFSPYRAQLVEAARATDLPTVVETQPLARMLAAAGDRVTSSSGVPGTLGGFLRDGPNGPVYAVTCGHVAGGGAASTPAGPLGMCVHAAAPVTLPAGIACSVTCGYLTDLDIALIDIPGAAVTNTAGSVAQIVSPGDIVEMVGATSGTMRYEIGAAVVDHLISGHCWGKLFQVHAPVSNSLWHTSVTVALAPPPRGGDSGAWLLRNGNEWVGMVVAGSALHGYALPSTHLLQRADSSFGTSLELY